jgi:hypothetical protein
MSTKEDNGNKEAMNLIMMKRSVGGKIRRGNRKNKQKFSGRSRFLQRFNPKADFSKDNVSKLRPKSFAY